MTAEQMTYPMIWVCLLAMCWGKNTLYLGGFYPLTKAFSAWGVGCLPAAELAIDHLNNRLDILPNFTLKLINMDTQVRRDYLLNYREFVLL